MAKRSQRRLSRHEREQAGCIWGLINIFDFRHGRSTKRLLSDRKRVSKQAVGAAGPLSIDAILPDLTKTYENEVDSEENKTPMNDIAKISVKELMEEEMFNEECLTNKSNNSEMAIEQMDSKHGPIVRKNQKKKNRKPSKSWDMDSSEPDAAICLKPEKILEKKASDNLDLKAIAEVLTHINQRNLNCMASNQDDLDIPSVRAFTSVDEKLAEAVKLFIEQRMSESQHFGEDEKEKPYCSKELVDALQTLSSNKGLILKLIKDPNSVFVKNLEDAGLEKDQTAPHCFSESNLSEAKPVNLETGNRKHRNFFRRRSKSMESFPLAEDNDSQSSSKIIILKPGPPGPAASPSPRTDIPFSNISLQSHYMENTKNISHFSFSEIKRRLRNAMGKERQEISPDGLKFKISSKQQNGNNGENLGWSSPNRNHFYTEKFAKSFTNFKKVEQAAKLKDDGAIETCQNPRHGASNIYVEARKHLSEILNNGDEKTEAASMQLSKSLGRILSLSEYNSSPCCSPRKNEDEIFITAQMRLSPRGMVKNIDSVLLQENEKNHEQNLESQSEISCSNAVDKAQFPDTNVNIPCTHDQGCSSEIQSSSEDSIIADVQDSSSRVVEIEEVTDLRPTEEERILNSSSASSSTSTSGDIRVDNNGSASVCLKDSSEYYKLDLSGEDQTLFSPAVSPSHSSVSREVDDSECAIDKIGRPSPVSVLEPLFTDDEISPASTISQPADKQIQPRHIHFEEQSSSTDQGICTRISLEDEESAFEYVEAVLLGSGLNWDDFILRWLSLYEILDCSLFEEVELFSSRSHDDQKLLFDCANEALKEICEIYFGCFCAIELVKNKIRPVPKGMDLIHEVWQRVEWRLFQYARPYSLDQLIKRDMESSGKWTNLQFDIEDIGFEMGDEIFHELVEDTVLSFVGDSSSYGDDENTLPIVIEESDE